MELGTLMDRAERLERRAGAVYRRFGAGLAVPAAATFFERIARQEDGHAEALAAGRGSMPPADRWRTRVDGWEDALADAEARLRDAEALPEDAPLVDRLRATLEIELSEIDEMRQRLLVLAGGADDPGHRAHATDLAQEARRLTDDPQIALQAALVQARARLEARA